MYNKKLAYCILLIILFSSYFRTVLQASSRPNLLFILTDDQRWDAFGHAGNPIILTPEMDKLAQTGAYFSHALVTTPICAASRASILTGLYERTHRYTFQVGPLRQEFIKQSYPAMLSKAGYYTGFYGKLGVNCQDAEPFFDTFEDYDRNGQYADRRGYFYKKLGNDTVHLTRYTGEKALEFIENAPADKPFCLSLSFSAPHAHDNAPEQYFWQPSSDNLYSRTLIPDPDLSQDRFFQELPEPVRNGFNRTRWRWRYDTPEKYQHSVKGYYRMITEIDQEIGKIRRKLAEKGLDKNTVIILMGDNGYFLGERQLAGKWLMYDNSIRVPLVVFDPRVKQPVRTDALALNIDVPATLMDLAGVEAPANWHGKSLMPLVSGKSNTISRDTALIEHLWEFADIPPSEGVRTAGWKYFRYINDKSLEYLYDLQADPKETRNLAGQPQYTLKLEQFRQKCDQLIQQHTDPDMHAPHGLMVEYIRQPEFTKINDLKPEYSWVVPSTAVFQKAYQLLVASNLQKINNNIGDVWDSGQVRSGKSTNVQQESSVLQPNSTYYWKVRIWDQDNRLSDYSPVQAFTTSNALQPVSSANWFQVEHISPTQFIPTAPGGYFIDFGKDAFGNLELTYQTNKADTLVVRLGEKLLNGRIDRQPGGSIRYQELKMVVNPAKVHYLLDLSADRRNTNQQAVPLPDSFGVITPFRYVEIDNASAEISPKDVRQRAYFHYFDYDESEFNSSDSILNQVWDICKYSMKATSFCGLYVDGDRERIPYEADAYINQLGHYSVDREYPMAKQTIEYFMQHPTWPTEWLLHTALMLHQDYYYTGDTELLETYFEVVKHKTLQALAREDGLISVGSGKVDGEYMQLLGFVDTTNRLRDIVDWPPAQKDTGWKLATAEGERDGHEMLPVNTVVNCFFYENMKIMADLAEVLGKPVDRDHFAYMAAKVKKTVNGKLFNKEKGIYLDGEGSTHSSVHSNMLPLAFGMVPEQYVKTVADYVKSRGMGCSVYGAQYLLEGLYRAGEAQYALDLMRATHDRSWWNMIRAGSTITLEAWDMKYKPNADWNHAWGAAPANIIPRYLWGIQPAKPGFEAVRITPQMGDLEYCKLKIPSIKGSIEADYKRVNNRTGRYCITLPGNVVGDFEVPLQPDSEITLNGVIVLPAFGSIRLVPGENVIEIRN